MNVRISSSFLIGLLGLALKSFSVAVLADTDKPNILFILADDVGQEVLGCYGGESYPTPNLDSLATEGQRYNHCYSMPVCHPSRTTLLTGRYPCDLKNAAWGSFPVAEESKTMAHTLRNAGYTTAIAGKWQLVLQGTDVNHPEKLGFDHSCLFGWHEGPRYHSPYLWQDGRKREATSDKYGPNVYTDFLINVMSEASSQPFFAFYSMALCHDVSDDLESPVPYPPGKQRYLSYAEMVSSMDQQIGKLLSALDRLNLRESTYVIFTGDNGTASRSIAHASQDPVTKKWTYHREEVWSMAKGQRIRGGKGSLKDTGTRVPLIVSRPGIVHPGIVDDLVDFSDFLPTFAALAGAKKPNGLLRGTSFAPRMQFNQPSPKPFAYAESRRGRSWVRTQRWKLYRDGTFYDLSQDPEERHDLSQANPLSPLTQRAQQQLLTIFAQQFPK